MNLLNWETQGLAREASMMRECDVRYWGWLQWIAVSEYCK